MSQLALDLKAGMQQSVEHADRVAPGWSERALNELRRFARVQDRPFTIEQARSRIVVDPPPDGRAWGSVTQSAIRHGFLARTGQYAPAESSNGSPKMLYTRGLTA